MLSRTSITLGRREVLMAGQRHDDLRADARMRKASYEPSPLTMRGRTFQAGIAIELDHELAQRVRGVGELPTQPVQVEKYQKKCTEGNRT